LKKDPKDKTNDWEIQEFKKQRPADVLWVAPFVEKTDRLNWRFLLYGYSKESCSPIYKGKSKSWQATPRWKEPWPMLNGGRKIFLFKVR
jgi:hypothetical protein